MEEKAHKKTSAEESAEQSETKNEHHDDYHSSETHKAHDAKDRSVKSQEVKDKLKEYNTTTFWQGLAIILAVFLLLSLFLDVDVSLKGSSKVKDTQESLIGSSETTEELELKAEVVPDEGFVIPVEWGDLGKQLMDSGVIDEKKFKELYEDRGGLSDEDLKLLEGSNNGYLTINSENANFLLNLTWALGLGNKNEILEKGPMSDPEYGGAERFASTGGWPLAKGDTMDHYSKHSFISLTSAQQQKVENVSKGIFRPCCGNSTHFPDCNHGMAMLGLLQLMASQDMSEADMYKAALQINSFWFPDTYLTIAKYKDSQGISWSEVKPQEVLGAEYSSAQGYQQILKKVEPVQQQGGAGCGA